MRLSNPGMRWVNSWAKTIPTAPETAPMETVMPAISNAVRCPRAIDHNNQMINATWIGNHSIGANRWMGVSALE